MTRNLLCGVALSLAFMSHAYAEDINVALAGPITGPYAAIGDQLTRGAEAAVNDINAAGGILGRKLKLIVEDDVCDPKQAVSVANRVVAENVAVMIGHFCSGATIPASEVYAENNLLEITISSNPVVTSRGLTNIFRIVGGDDQQAVVAAEFVDKHFADARIAVLDDKTAFGAGLAGLVADKLKAAGRNVVMRDAINPGEKDYSTVVSRLKDLRVDVLYYGGYYTEAALIKRQATDIGLDIRLVGGDPLGNSDFAAMTGKADTNTFFTFPVDPNDVPVAKATVDRFKQNGVRTDGYMLYAYASVQVFAQGASITGGTDTDAIGKVIRAQGVDTVIGHVKFDDHGNINSSGYVMNLWDGANYRLADQ